MRNVRKPFLPPRGYGVVAMALGCLLICSPACGGESAKKKSSSKKAKPVEVVEMEPMVVTGSAIPQRVGKPGRVMPLASNVAVIDRDAIQRSGSATLVGVLRMSQASSWRR